MTTTKTIAKYLGLTEEQYYDEYVSRYMRWAMQFTLKGHETDLQKLLANTAINNYYTERHDDLEHQAVAVLKAQDGKITINAARGIYNSIMVEIFSQYPKPLFDIARRLVIIGNPNAN